MLRRRTNKKQDAVTESETPVEVADNLASPPSDAPSETGDAPVNPPNEPGLTVESEPEGPEVPTEETTEVEATLPPAAPITGPPHTDAAPRGKDAKVPQRLTSQERKKLSQEWKEAAKQQRVADKLKRKEDRKAAKEARRTRRIAEPSEALSLDPLSPTSPETLEQAPDSTVKDLQAPSESTKGKLDLPPISPPGTFRGQSAPPPPPPVGGIDLGGTKIAAAVVDWNNKVIAYRRRPTPDRGGPADVVRAMALTMQEAATDAGLETSELAAVGVGAPGSVDPETGAVSGAGNLPDWAGTFQLQMALSEALGTEVRVGNDVQVGTRAEYELGAGADYSSLLGVFWGTGVGGGIILDGELWLGRGRAGEIGHTLVRRGGAKGLNGLNGTVEAYAGRKAMEEKARREVKKGRKTKLFKLMKKHDKPHLTSAIWQRALEDGDELAEDLLNRAVEALSAGIASAVNLLDPEAVVIGGGLGVRFGDTLVPEIISGMDKYLLNKENPPVVKVAALGDEGGVIGAALLVRDLAQASDTPS